MPLGKKIKGNWLEKNEMKGVKIEGQKPRALMGNLNGKMVGKNPNFPQELKKGNGKNWPLENKVFR